MTDTRISKQRSTSRFSRSLREKMRSFADDESGVIVAFSVWFMLLILFVGAIGVDVMRFESQRTRLQSALDQAVLAAADLDQKSAPASVVADYFDKFDVDATLTSTIVDQGLNYRNVKATAEQIVPTHIIHMLGVDQMTAPAASEAEERVEGVEVSMVLDVSGSMSGNRIGRLRPAAIEFVDTVLDLSDANDVSISVIPYATQVGVGETLMSQFRTHDDQPNSYCINFEGSDFNSTTMQVKAQGSRSYEATQHFDPWYEVDDPQVLSHPFDTRSRTGRTTLPVCPNYEHSQILPLSNNTTDLYGRINGLQPGGNTSIDIGVKWGAALLDPSLQQAVTNMIASGDIDANFAQRPTSYSDPDSIKVMVVMTDGQNTSQYYLKQPYRSGDSNVWYNDGNDRYAIYYNNRYYYQTYSGNSYIRSSNWTWNLSNSWERMTNQDLFARVSTEYIDDVLYRNFGNFNWDTGVRSYVGGGTKDNRLQAICNQAKSRGIVIYTIGFEAPQHGANQLEACASTPSHFFDVEGVEISEAFSAIAQSISQLKLVQ